MEHKNIKNNMQVDWTLTLVPLGLILFLCVFFLAFPRLSANAIVLLRTIFIGKLGVFYMVFGLAVFLISIWLAASRYGCIKLGAIEKPRFSNFAWGAMIFTSTMAADILYWSLIEWAYYFRAKPFGIENMSLVQKQDFASAYPLFHWGPIPWSFYLLPAVAYAYMFYVKGRRKQTLSEACRSIIGKHSDGWLGKGIDIFSIVGLLAGTATTFSLATPLLSLAVARIFGIYPSTGLTIGVLILIAATYTVAVITGMKGISRLANICVGLFVILVGIFLFSGPTTYIVESGVTGFGKMVSDFFSMATWMDPLRVSGTSGFGFPQDWTIFYWAYWIAWFVATPFFIGKISEGRTIRQTMFGGLACGLLGTYTSFIVFGNFGLYQQVSGKIDLAGLLAGGALPADVILQIFSQLSIPGFALVILVLAMIAFYASTFDAITLVVSEYSMKDMGSEEEPPKAIKIFWAVVFILLPIVLIFSESTLRTLQALSVVAAFPLALIMGLVIYAFMKDIKHDEMHKERCNVEQKNGDRRDYNACDLKGRENSN